MKVLFPDISLVNSGRGFFLQALSRELSAQGVDIVFDGEHDISLHPIRMFCKSKKPRILRLDGVYHDTGKDWYSKNEGLKSHADAADGIVCQSQFSKQMVMKFLSVPEKKIHVIFNGAEVERPRGKNKSSFIALAKWRPHKRLTDIINAFQLAAIPRSRLYVVGNIDKSDYCGDMNKKINITFVGEATHEYVKEQLSNSIASIHLCWFDCCPNSVVEAIACKCPVITNNVGGTHEIVSPSGGFVIDLDREYDFRPVDLYHPPRIDLNKVAQAMWDCTKNPPEIIADHVDIKNIARQYKEYFERFI